MMLHGVDKPDCNQECILTAILILIVLGDSGIFYGRKVWCHLSAPIGQFAMYQTLKNES